MGILQDPLPGMDALAVRQPNPLVLVADAVQRGLAPETIKQLMDLAERAEANEARRAYVQAMNAFKANPPTITKNKRVHFVSQKGTTDYNHATLDNVCDVVGSALSKHGLSHRWETDQSDGRISVTCIITHAQGHSEKTTLRSDPDATGNKNSIQAIGSAVTYLQRYTLLALTGLATEEDNDGVTLTQELADVLDIIKKSETKGELQGAYAEGYKLARDLKEKAIVIDAYEKRKKELPR